MSPDAASQRQHEILGRSPRLSPLAPHELTDAAIEINNRIRAIAIRDLETKTLENMPEVVATMLRHSALFERQVTTGIQISVHGTLAPRERELAVLRIGWLCGAPYEFGEHVHIARGLGFSSADIAAIKIGSGDTHWMDTHERAILAAVEELHGNAMIADTTWAVLAQSWNEQQLIELPMLVGHYQQTAYIQNTLRLRLHPGNDGLMAR